MSASPTLSSRLPRLEDIEGLEQYCGLGGFDPISIGDVFAGRYKVLHKLGYGGSSTVWLAQDRRAVESSGRASTLMTLKVLSAKQSS